MEEENELTSISSIGGKPIKKEISANYNQEYGHLIKDSDLGQSILVIEDHLGHPSFEPEHFVLNNFNGDNRTYHYGAIFTNNNELNYREWIADTGNLETKITIDDEDYWIISAVDYPVDGGSDLTAGTDLVIDNGTIKVNTDGTVGNSADMPFVAGSGTYASGVGAIALGHGTVASGIGSHAEGEYTCVVGNYSHAEGYSALASATGSHAEGGLCTANGNNSHAEGCNTKAVGGASHAEGYATSAIGIESHSEGCYTYSFGNYSHAEGLWCEAINEAAHAEGCYTSAIGLESHTEGCDTIAGDNYMHVGGKYNYTSANAAFVIGNGEDIVERSDAFIVYWDGSVSASDYKTSARDSVAEIITMFKSLSAWARSSGWTPPSI